MSPSLLFNTLSADVGPWGWAPGGRGECHQQKALAVSFSVWMLCKNGPADAAVIDAAAPTGSLHPLPEVEGPDGMETEPPFFGGPETQSSRRIGRPCQRADFLFNRVIYH